MKNFFLVAVVLTLFASVGFAQTTTPSQPQTPPPAQTPPAGEITGKNLSDVLSWLIGRWEGTGVSTQGEPEFSATMICNEELDGTALLLHRESMSKSASQVSGVKELMIIGFDGITKKIIATIYKSNNVIGLYVGELGQNQITFSAATAQPGYVDRRSFQRAADGTLHFVIEGASPGKEVSKQVEINFKKKS